MTRNAPENGLTAVQQVAGTALAAGQSIEEAAATARVNPRTVKRWLADGPAFRSFISGLRTQATDRVLGQLVEGMLAGAATLRSLCLNARSESVKLGAARSLLEMGTKLREATELEQRLADLEANQPGRSR